MVFAFLFISICLRALDSSPPIDAHIKILIPIPSANSLLVLTVKWSLNIEIKMALDDCYREYCLLSYISSR